MTTGQWHLLPSHSMMDGIGRQMQDAGTLLMLCICAAYELRQWTGEIDS